jgi:hypothetical protein
MAFLVLLKRTNAVATEKWVDPTRPAADHRTRFSRHRIWAEEVTGHPHAAMGRQAGGQVERAYRLKNAES